YRQSIKHLSRGARTLLVSPAACGQSTFPRGVLFALATGLGVSRTDPVAQIFNRLLVSMLVTTDRVPPEEASDTEAVPAADGYLVVEQPTWLHITMEFLEWRLQHDPRYAKAIHIVARYCATHVLVQPQVGLRCDELAHIKVGRSLLGLLRSTRGAIP